MTSLSEASSGENILMQVPITLATHHYEIFIGHNIYDRLKEILAPLSLGTDAIVVTNPVIKKLHGATLSSALKDAGFTVKFFEVPDGEESKSGPFAFELIEKIAEYNVGRKIFIVAFGGGVVGDLAGFVAASYRRGIPYIQVPTTLLAQVDSAIGGKVAVDLPAGKNLVGAFYQPWAVISDVAVLSTLSQRQIQNGLAEIIKYGAICDHSLFEMVRHNVDKLLNLHPKITTDVVTICSRIKAKIVMSDEKETKGVRTMLNFGHTVGHAIEAANHFQDYQHGEAVALGMRAAVDISCKLNLLSLIDAQQINALITAAGLPERLKNVELADVMRHMAYDKKFTGKKNKFVLLTTIGGVKVVAGIDENIVEKALAALG
jgi:3-dehydroquinate synthase